MRPSFPLAALVLAAFYVTPVHSQTVVVVPGTGDLYAAGRASGFTCCNGDSTPAESPVLASLPLFAGEVLTFSASGGATNYPSPPNPTPDGNTSSTYDLHADYGTGISGPTNVHLAGLAGVFLGPDTPGGAAPAQLSGTTFSSISPGLDQIFFIGDGLTGTGSGGAQTFIVPDGATRLYLGVIDDGGYYDNSGEITAFITGSSPPAGAPAPLAGAGLLSFLGAGGVAARRRVRLIFANWFARKASSPA